MFFSFQLHNVMRIETNEMLVVVVGYRYCYYGDCNFFVCFVFVRSIYRFLVFDIMINDDDDRKNK